MFGARNGARNGATCLAELVVWSSRVKLGYPQKWDGCKQTWPQPFRTSTVPEVPEVLNLDSWVFKSNHISDTVQP